MAVGAAGLDAVLLTPGPDLRYVIGYDAKQLERLTCLAVPAEGDPALFVPRLELAAAQASPAGWPSSASGGGSAPRWAVSPARCRRPSITA